MLPLAGSDVGEDMAKEQEGGRGKTKRDDLPECDHTTTHKKIIYTAKEIILYIYFLT